LGFRISDFRFGTCPPEKILAKVADFLRSGGFRTCPPEKTLAKVADLIRSGGFGTCPPEKMLAKVADFLRSGGFGNSEFGLFGVADLCGLIEGA